MKQFWLAITVIATIMSGGACSSSAQQASLQQPKANAKNPLVRHQLPHPSPVQAPGTDNANFDPPKSWVRDTPPTPQDQQFLNILQWKPQSIGAGYTLKTGIIYDKWIAAMQFVKDGKTVLTEYTPPQEYIVVVDAATGERCTNNWARDVNHDGLLEIAFMHCKLHDANYHMYTIYALDKKAPKLLWKSGGQIGDWLASTTRPPSTDPALFPIGCTRKN
jgi:hypothetical protein